MPCGTTLAGKLKIHTFSDFLSLQFDRKLYPRIFARDLYEFINCLYDGSEGQTNEESVIEGAWRAKLRASYALGDLNQFFSQRLSQTSNNDAVQVCETPTLRAHPMLPCLNSSASISPGAGPRAAVAH